MKKSRKGLIAAACVSIGLIVVFLLFRKEALAASMAVVAGLRSLGPLAFFAAMAVLPSFGFPLLPFALTAGPAFAPVIGPLWVVALSVLAVAANAGLTYIISKYMLTSAAQRVLRHFGYSIPTLPGGTHWQVALAVRLAPGLPFWTQGYLLGLMRIPWVPYVIVSTAVPSVYLCAAILLGASAWDGHLKGVLLSAALLGFAAILISLWRAKVLYRTSVKA